MAKDDQKKISRVKSKRKTWFKIFSPKLFGEKEVGEIYLAGIDKALGRSLKINLRELSGNPTDQNIYIDLKITAVDGSTLKTTILGYHLTSTYVKRMVRKNADRIDDYLVLKTKEGQEVILKLLAITRNKVQRSVKTELKRQLKELLKEEIKKGSFDDFMGNLVKQKTQGSIKKKLHKIYPLKEFSVRVLKFKKGQLKKEAPSEELIALEKEKIKEKLSPAEASAEQPQPVQEAA